VRDVKRLLVEYLREAVIDAKGNVVSFNLKKVKKALEAESKAEEIALKAALEALVDLGLLGAVPGRKPRYVLRRGSPLWVALELGCTDMLTVLMDRHRMKQKPT
jgi:hypothetical protein